MINKKVRNGSIFVWGAKFFKGLNMQKRIKKHSLIEWCHENLMCRRVKQTKAVHMDIRLQMSYTV